MTIQRRTNPTKVSFFLLCALPLAAQAQYAGVVPEGVLAVIGGYRYFSDQGSTWNANGKKIPMTSSNQIKFDGESLLRGDGGVKLKSLAEEIKRYDPASNQPSSLLKRLNLGTLNVGGKKNFNVQYFGLALGLPRNQTLYVVAPLVDLQVKTTFSFDGINNATAIRDELGSLAFKELKDGLDKAAAIRAADVKASIESEEYTGVDSWRYKNWADLIFGYVTDLIAPANGESQSPDFSLQAELFTSAPTGHVDNPDILSDASIGTGAWGFGLGLTPRLKCSDFAIGMETNATAYVPTKRVMRVPYEDEAIVAASRRTSVNVQAGINWEVTGFTEARFDWFQPQYRISYRKSERDNISGPLTGNYAALMKDSEKRQFEHSLWFYFSTIEAFKRKEFPLPLRIKIAASQMLKAFNSKDESRVEIQLTSFLPTPLMPE